MPTPATLTQGQPYLGGTVQYDSATGRQLNAGETTLASPAPTTNPRLRDFSIALTKGQITNQADTNAFFGNTQSGASVPTTQGVTPQIPSNSPTTVDPLASLNPQQRSDFSKQFSIALSKGQLSDQTSVDKFKNDYALGAQGGSSPTIASTQPKGTISNSGQSANVQNNIASSSGSTSSGYYPRGGASSKAEDYLNTFQEPQTKEEINAQKLREAQGSIDALNKYNESLAFDQSRVNAERSSATNAQSVINGLSGSTEATNRFNQTNEVNQAGNAKILAQKNVDLQNIYRQVQTDAQSEYDKQRTNARESATGIRERNDVLQARDLAAKSVNEAKASTNAQTLAKSGFDIDSMKQNDPTTYKWMSDSVGGEQMLKALFVLNRPKEDIVDKKIDNGYYTVAYRNPITGATRVESINLHLPPNFNKTVDAGDRILAIPNGWDGDPKKLITINKGLTPKDANKNAGTSTGTYQAGDNPTVDGWIQQIQDQKAKITNVPKNIQGLVVQGLTTAGNSTEGKPTVTELGKSALANAKELMTTFDSGNGTSAVGASRNYGGAVLGMLSGTSARDFTNTVDAIKSQLALEGVKYLKGQGSVSDAERALLSQAVTKLNVQQSEPEFRKTLQGIIDKLSGNSETEAGGANGGANGGKNESSPTQGMYDGELYNIDANGEMTPA